MAAYAGLGLRAPRGSGAARSRAYAGQTLALEIVGLRQAERIPAELQAAYQGMMSALETELVASFRSFVPGAPMGRLGRQVQSRRLSNGRIVVGTFGSRFAAALDRGFTSSTESGRALRFVDNGQVFYRRRIHVRGRHFFAKAIAASDPIVKANYFAFFDNLRRF